jgi:hypothetical protein
MIIKISKLKIFLCSLVVITTSLAFPLQVYFGNPYPSLFPYFFIGLIFVLNAISLGKTGWSKVSLLPKNNIGLILRIYLFLVFSQTTLQVIIGVISFYEFFSTFVNYIFPVLFYIYFSQYATEKEIKVVIIAVGILALIIGIYFAYESYIKLSQFKLTDYAIKAYEYSLSQSSSENFNDGRIQLGIRSFGLLESHSVSSAWTIIGTISFLAMVDKEKKILRLIIILFNGILLLLALNFTSIIAYLFIIFFIEFNGFSLLKLKLSYKLIINSIIIILFIYVFSQFISYFIGDRMVDFITKNLIGQTDFALGNSVNNVSYFDIILNNISGYLNHIFTLPHSFLIGDGYSSFGLKKGGDIGFVESLAKFGFPFFITILYGIYILINSGFNKIKLLKIMEIPNSSMSLVGLQFAVSFMFLILISDIHYSIWYSKSILPFFFFSLALFDRYLYRSS